MMFGIDFVLVCVLLIVGWLVLYKWYGNRELIKYCQLLPQYKRLSIIHDIVWFKRVFSCANPVSHVYRLSYSVSQMYQKQRIYVAWVAYRPYVVFYKPDTIEDLLNNSSALDKSWEYRFLHPWLGTGLLTSSGKKWRSRRKLLTSSFHFRILEDFVPIFNEQSEILAQKVRTLAARPWVDIAPLVTRCTLDIICETAMGIRINAQSGGSSSYVNAIKDIGSVFVKRSLEPWLWIDFIFNYFFPTGWKFRKDMNTLHNFSRQVIKEKKKSMLEQAAVSEEDENRKKKKAFLELLLEHHFKDDSFTEEDIREEVDTFMFEGHDTTAMAISWTIYCLGLYPEIQERVFQEISYVFQDDFDRKITSDDVKNLKYLECVLKETLRLYPSVPVFERELKDSIKVLNYTIPKGCLCVVSLPALHHDPEQFPDPEKFNPDRFLPENSVGRHPYAYIPFSAGPRNCIGQRFALTEEKVVLTQIIRKFKFTSLDQRDAVNTTFALTLKNSQPLRIRFIPRAVV